MNKFNYIEILVVAIVAIFLWWMTKHKDPEPMQANAEDEGNGHDIKTPQGKYFSITEMHCHDGKKVPQKYYAYVQELFDNLDKIREYLGKPLKINSGWRSPEYNAKIGGVKSSAHLYGYAADLKPPTGMNSWQLACEIKNLMENKVIKKGGLGIYDTFVHYDIWQFRFWNERTDNLKGVGYNFLA